MPSSQTPEFDTIFYENGDYYEGDALDRQPHGQGTMYYDNGDIRKGYWLYGTPITKNIVDRKIPFCDSNTYTNSVSVNYCNFVVGYGYDNATIAEAFGISKFISGIRLHGNCAVLVSLDDSVYRDGIGWEPDYDDEPIFRYTGEGLEGNQTMTRGNYFLGNSYDKDIFLFVRRKPNDYTFNGKVRVKRVDSAIEPDKRGHNRNVFKFILRRV